MQVMAHQQRNAGLCQHVTFEVDPRGDLDHGEPGLGQLDDATFGDVENVLPALTRHLTGEGDLGDLGNELGNRAVRDDVQPAIGDLDVLLAGSEVAGVDDLGCAGDDVVEAPDAGGDVRSGGKVRDVHIPGAGNLQEGKHRHVETAALQQRELINTLHQRLRVERAAEGEPRRREAADRALLDHPGDVLGVTLLQQHSWNGGRDSEAQVYRGIDLELGGSTPGDHLLQAELHWFDLVQVAMDLTRQGRVVGRLSRLHLIGGHHDRVDQDARNVHSLGGQLRVGQPLDLSDDDPVVVVGGVGLIQCAKSAALFLIGQVAVRVRGCGADDRDVDLDGGVEQVLLAGELHELDEVVGGGVHLRALPPRIGVSAEAHLRQHPGLTG